MGAATLAGWAHADLYYEQDGGISVLRTGTRLPPQNELVASSFLLLPLPLETNRATTFYLAPCRRHQSIWRGTHRRLVTIQRLDANQVTRRNVLFAQGVYAGIILALVLYNLILYFAIAERAYLYYSLYVLTFGSVWIARTGFFFQYLWPHYPVVESEAPFYLVVLAIVFSSLFVREFLATREQSRWVDRILLTRSCSLPQLCVC